jgi:acyl-CoA hydrolase
MEIGVRVETENLLTGLRRHTNSCYLTFVAIDDARHPVEVPPLLPETEEEQGRFRAAERRRAHRIEHAARKAAGS